MPTGRAASSSSRLAGSALAAPLCRVAGVLRRPLLRPGLPPELLLNRLDHELHDRDVIRHAVQLEPAVKLFRDAGRQLRPGFVCRRHLRRLGLRARCPPRTTATPATAADLCLRGYGRRHLRARHPLGNGLRRTTGTTWAPLPACLATTAPTVLRLRLRAGRDAPEQRLDGVPHLLLHEIADYRHQAPLPRHCSSLRLRQRLLHLSRDQESAFWGYSLVSDSPNGTAGAKKAGVVR